MSPICQKFDIWEVFALARHPRKKTVLCQELHFF